jgi:hypothetical protein
MYMMVSKQNKRLGSGGAHRQVRSEVRVEDHVEAEEPQPFHQLLDRHGAWPRGSLECMWREGEREKETLIVVSTPAAAFGLDTSIKQSIHPPGSSPNSSATATRTEGAMAATLTRPLSSRASITCRDRRPTDEERQAAVKWVGPC